MKSCLKKRKSKQILCYYQGCAHARPIVTLAATRLSILLTLDRIKAPLNPNVYDFLIDIPQDTYKGEKSWAEVKINNISYAWYSRCITYVLGGYFVHIIEKTGEEWDLCMLLNNVYIPTHLYTLQYIDTLYLTRCSHVNQLQTKQHKQVTARSFFSSVMTITLSATTELSWRRHYLKSIY